MNQDSNLNSLVPEYEKEKEDRKGQEWGKEKGKKKKENLNMEDASHGGWMDDARKQRSAASPTSHCLI